VSYNLNVQILLNLNDDLTGRTKDKAWEPSRKESSFGRQSALDRKIVALFFHLFGINRFECFCLIAHKDIW